MDLPALSGAASIALATTVMFALVVRGWQAVSDRFGSGHACAGAVMNEAAQRIRDQWVLTGRRQSAYLVAGLVFSIVFITVWLLQGKPVLAELPDWQLIALLVFVGIAASAAACRFFRLLSLRRQLRLERDATLVTGHALQRLSGSLNRIFHDVPCSAGVIDHVIAGLHGIYAVNVVAKRPGKDGRVKLQGDEVHFASRHGPVSIDAFRATAQRLARECSKAVRHDVHIRCVVALPGWEIAVQTSSDLLLVNERNISMIAGWKDQRDYLMNEDVDVLQQLLTERCTRIVARG